MTTVRRFVPVLVLAAAALGAAAALAWSAWGHGGRAGQQPAVGEAPVAFTASISPAVQLVGDRVVATVDLTVDRARTNPTTVGVIATFAPYSRVGAVGVVRRDAGRVTTLRYTYVLQCVDRPCIALASKGLVRLHDAIVRYASPLGQALLPVAWPTLTPISRLPAGEDVGAPVLRTGSLEPPSVSYAVSPPVLGWLFASFSAAFVLAAGALAARRLRRAAPAGPRIAPAPAEPERPPLDRALELVERASLRDEGERRTTLDALARALEEDGLSAFAPGTRRLAWSERPPAAVELSALAAEIRRALAGEEA